MLKIQENQETKSKLDPRAASGWKAFLQRKDLGFWQLPERDSVWVESESWGHQIREKFSDLVVIGLGGSSMGARTLSNLYQEPGASHRLHICDNVDALEFERLIRTLPSLQKTAWVVISKSGSTVETMLTLEMVLQNYQKKNVDFKNHLYVVTEETGNPLHLFAKKHQLPVLPVPLDVGGRFSVFTPCGLVPAAFLGCSLSEIRSGAGQALKNETAILGVVSEVLSSYDRHETITMFWSYSSHLREFGGWMMQLWAESLGKKTDRGGGLAPKASTPIAAIGACDQHSVLQQVMEGTRDKFVIFQRVQSVEKHGAFVDQVAFEKMDYLNKVSMGQLLAAEAQATAQALTEVGVHNLTLQMQDLSPRSVGELLMFWQLVVGCLGECLNINAFDQPGVELGKRLARSILQHSK